MPEAVSVARKPAVAVPMSAPKQARGDSLELHEFRNARWRHGAAPGVTREDLTKPGYLTVAGEGRLKSFDVVEVVGPGGSYWAELLVTYAEPSFAPIVKELRYVDTGEVKHGKHGNIPAGHEIRFDPQSALYTGFRVADKNGAPLDRAIPLTQSLPNYEDVRVQVVTHASLR